MLFSCKGSLFDHFRSGNLIGEGGCEEAKEGATHGPSADLLAQVTWPCGSWGLAFDALLFRLIRVISFLLVLFELRVLLFGVKILGLIFIDCT